ncbi:MAG: hypothetical protein ACI9EZ_001156, partial [Halobacteriales archaeon]
LEVGGLTATSGRRVEDYFSNSRDWKRLLAKFTGVVALGHQSGIATPFVEVLKTCIF